MSGWATITARLGPCPHRHYEPIAVPAPTTPPISATATASRVDAMTPQELRSSASLASIFALRMLGLFLVLPVFALEARRYPGGDDVAMVGLAMGIYGLTQGMLQIPFGVASDRFGRKRVMVIGLLIFALGSAIAALAPTLAWLMAGRAIQGAGAISAAVTALLADQTRDAVRTKAMALVGVSIGVVFSASLVLSPVLNSLIGLGGMFALTMGLALAGIAIVVLWVPPEPPSTAGTMQNKVWHSLAGVIRNPALQRLYAGVFALHAVQMAMWLALPAMLVQAGLAKDQHGWVYLPAVLGSFLVMGAGLFPLERRGYLRAVFLSAIGIIGLVQCALVGVVGNHPSPAQLAWLLFVFFCGFNVLEASQPSMASRTAPAHSRGAALGVYNSLQSLGLFTGASLGGWVVREFGAQTLFAGCAAVTLAWLLFAWAMPQQPGAAHYVAVKGG